MDSLFLQKLVLAMMLTAVAFGWTSWNLISSPQLQSPASLAIAAVLLIGCLTAWAMTIRSLYCCRNTVHESAKALETKDQLTQERDLLRMVIDNLPDHIYAKDTAGRFVLNNLSHSRCLGVASPRELVGKSDFDFFPPELAGQFHEDEKRIVATGKPIFNQEQFKQLPGDTSGDKRWSYTSKVIWRDPQAGILGTVGITRDIHETKLAQNRLRESEERLRKVMAQTHCILSLGEAKGPAGWRERALDAESPFLWNFPVLNVEAAQEVLPLDLTDGKEYHQAWRDSRNVEDNSRMNLSSGNAFLLETPFYRNEFRCTDKHGVEHWMQQFVTVQKLAEDHWQLFSITTDITDLKMTELALRASEAQLQKFTGQLERSNRELQDFAYVASHDLQEPLRKIVVFGERLKEKHNEALGAEAADYLERMQKAATRMQNLINDLLAFSRVTSKSRPFARLDLAEIARGVVEDLEGRIEMVKGRVELGDLPAIDGEELQLRQLLQNLIGNALKFRRPEEAPVVKVEAEIISGRVPAGGFASPAEKLCRLTVSDNGIGFEEKYLDRIFNVFQRLHARNEYEGTGMGLAIARKIVLHHGGDITAKSKPGRGTTFIVTLPMIHSQNHEPHNTNNNHEK